MMNLWTESDIIIEAGKRYLNSVASRRFLDAYSDRLKLVLDDDDEILIGYDYATKVVKRYPVRNIHNSHYSLQDFLGNNMPPVKDNETSTVYTSDSSEKQLPVLVPQKDFIRTKTSKLKYTDDELEVINYFKEKGKVDLNKIPLILKGQGFSPDKLVEYGYLLSKALPWYKFTSSDEQELRDKAMKARILNHDLRIVITNCKDLSDVIAVLKAYKKYGNNTCSEDELLDAIYDFLADVTDEVELKKFWDDLSNDEVYEAQYLKDYFGKIYPFKEYKDNEAIDVDIVITPNPHENDIDAIIGNKPVNNDEEIIDIDISGLDDIIPLDDNGNFDTREIYDEVKAYIDRYFIIHNDLVLGISKVEWTKQFIGVLYKECTIKDNQILLNTLYQCLAEREPLNISRSDINNAFTEFKDELENINDEDMKDQIQKCIDFGNPYHELLKVYQNVHPNRWDKCDEYVIMCIKDRIDYSLSITSKDSYRIHARSLGIIMSDIKKLSKTLNIFTFSKLAISLNKTSLELDKLLSTYNIGLGDPIKDFGLKKDESEKNNNEESFKIKKRRKPKTKQDIKKFIYATLAGAGIISCLYLTIVLGRNPINVIKNCVSTFTALFKGNSTLAALGASMGNLTTYFGSAILALGSGSKLGKLISQEEDNSTIKQDNSTVSEPAFEELQEPDDIDLSDLVWENSGSDTPNDTVAGSVDDAIEFTDEEFASFMGEDTDLDAKRR